MYPKIGFIGLGVVGGAVAASYNSAARLVCRDPALGFNSSWEELKECEGIFVCVPSPNLSDGSCDSSILEDVLSNLTDYNGVIISKVTATPDIYERLQKQYTNLVYVPEFLTAADAHRDYQIENWIVAGGHILAYRNEAIRIIKYTKPDATVIQCYIGEAAILKYIVNSFLATKVVFMNEMSELAETAGYDWSKIQSMMWLDKRIGPSHTAVPGTDGQYGFGGMCFPKDTSAFLKYAIEQGCDLSVLNKAVKKNTLLRLKKPK